MMNPESEDFYQWTAYKARMQAAISRADALSYQLREHQALLAAVVLKFGGTVRLALDEYWNKDLNGLGVVMKREPSWDADPYRHSRPTPAVIVLSVTP